MIKFILDPGHGSDTPGKRAGELREWLFNRDIVRYISFSLLSLKIPHHILIPGHYDVSLGLRCSLADAVADDHKAETGDDSILISVHGNAFKDKSVTGIETFYYSTKGKEIADVFQDELVSAMGWKERGVRQANFTILERSSMPAILTESGFYTNPQQREVMLSPEGRYEIAMAHVEAIKKFAG